MARYQIWDGTSDIYTPSGEKNTPEQYQGITGEQY